VSVADALKPLNQGSREVHLEDDHHQPASMKILNKPPYDPEKKFLKGCITTGGGDNYHFTGKRRYTPRENSLFQTFPYGYHFTGSNAEATKQIGNALPPCMAEALYWSCAKTLEAFDNDLIDADAEIDDLDRYLARKGFNIPQCTPRQTNLFSSSSSQSSIPESPYRYLFRPVDGGPSCAPRTSTRQSVFGYAKPIEPRSEIEKRKPVSFFNFLNRNTDSAASTGKNKKRRNDSTDKQKFEQATANGDIIEIDSD
jgi:DNA (cytosine-5)-methyltransferase 1